MSKTAFANGVRFRARPAGINGYDDDEEDCDKTVMCKGCVFKSGGAEACTAASAAAVEAGLPDCDSSGLNPGYVYVRDKRQEPRT